MIKTKKNHYQVRVRMWKNWNSHSICCGWECKAVQPLWKTVWQFLKNLPSIPAVKVLSIHSKKLKIYVHTKTYKQMFIAVLFIIAKSWKQPRCSSVGEWVSKHWNIQTTEYYSVWKQMLYQSPSYKTWNALLLSERSQPGKAAEYMISAMWRPGKGITLETKKISCFQVLGRGRGEQAEHRERLGQGNSSVGRCKSRYMSLQVLQSLSRVWLLRPPDCSLPGSSVHGDSLGKKTGVGRHFLLQGIFPTQDSNLGPLHCRQILYQLSYEGSPKCTRHYMLVKSIEGITWLWVTMASHCRSSAVTNIPLQCGMCMEEGYTCVEAGVLGTLCTFHRILLWTQNIS